MGCSADTESRLRAAGVADAPLPAAPCVTTLDQHVLTLFLSLGHLMTEPGIDYIRPASRHEPPIQPCRTIRRDLDLKIDIGQDARGHLFRTARIIRRSPFQVVAGKPTLYIEVVGTVTRDGRSISEDAEALRNAIEERLLRYIGTAPVEVLHIDEVCDPVVLTMRLGQAFARAQAL
ncbi:MAG: hypothetical protein ABF876_05535 [Acetobacter aceti]|nr:hypothetical protein [Acetobacter aceti]